MVGTGANLALDRRWVARLGGYDERLGTGSAGGAGEDVDVLYRVLRAGARVRYEPAAIVFHERQDLARRLATRSSYGRGIGACCGAWMRGADPYAALLLGRWLASRARRLARATLQGDRLAMREERLVLAGTAAGLRYGIAITAASRAIAAPDATVGKSLHG
jgi:GT2 family glycosyltransferase